MRQSSTSLYISRVVCSTGVCVSFLRNPTHGSGWIVQAQPTTNANGLVRIPPTAVGGSFKSCLLNGASTNLCACGASHEVGGECSEATGRLCLDDLPAAWVGFESGSGPLR